MKPYTKEIKDKFLGILRAEVGYHEDPPNSNLTKYGRWYGLDGVPWCVIFVQWALHQAGAKDYYKTASCSAWMSNAKKWDGQWVTGNYKPGDIVMLTKDGKTPFHCGVISSLDTYGYAYTVEGNTSDASEDNGGSVMMRYRRTNTFLGAVRLFEHEVKTVDAYSLPMLYRGCYGISVKNWQSILEGSYDISCGKGGCDGDFGKDTEAATIAFQRSKGLVEDGVVGPKTYSAAFPKPDL